MSNGTIELKLVVINCSTSQLICVSFQLLTTICLRLAIGTSVMEQLQIQFPTEIIEKILIHVDGRTLLAAEQVCTHWRDIIKFLSEKRCIWKKHCARDIPKETLHTFLDKSWFGNEGERWEKIFRNFEAWQNVKKNNFYLTAKEDCEKIEKGFVTCVTVSGNRIIYGTSLGNVVILNELYEQIGTFEHDITFPVRQLHLMRISVKNTHTKDPYYAHSHVVLVYDKLFKLLRLTPILEEVDAVWGPGLKLSIYGDLICYASLNGLINVIKICSQDRRNCFLPLTCCKIYTPDIVRNICIFNDTILWLTNGKLMSFNYRTAPPVAQSVLVDRFSFGYIDAYWVFYNKIVFLRANHILHLLRIDLPDTMEHTPKFSFNCMEYLGSPVCALYLHGNVLFISTTAGKVYIYNVKDWSVFELQKYDFVFNVYSEQIIGIDVQELDNEHCIILATEKLVTQVILQF